MRRPVVLALTITLLLPATASATTVSLSKREARREAVYFVKERANERDWSWATWYDVEPAYKCSRTNARIVWCDFDLVDETDMDDDGYVYGCADSVRIRETRTHYYAKFSPNPDCGYYWE